MTVCTRCRGVGGFHQPWCRLAPTCLACRRDRTGEPTCAAVAAAKHRTDSEENTDE